MRTPIRWAGSKKALLPLLKRHWPGAETRYVEPFCGSACLFFDIEPQEAILSDLNAELITTYRIISLFPEKIAECLRRYPLTKEQYYSLRSINPNTISDVELAARFIFLNRFCFNGIYRTNRAGHFNVPFATPKYAPTIDIDGIISLSEILRRATLVNADFEMVLAQTERGDFVYLDPPYAVRKRRIFAEYHPDSFSERDIDRLREALRQMDKRGVRFLLSYADSREGRLLAQDWNWRRIRTKRNVAGFVAHRRSAYELLASNQDLPDGP